MVGEKFSDELSWSAFRYVAGEMSSLEEAAFEARMLDDVDACEAVARMALVCEAANASFERPQVALSALPIKHRSPRWAAVATLAAVAWMVGIGVWFANGSRAERRLNAEIVGMWSSTAAPAIVDEGNALAVEDIEVPQVDVASTHGDLVVPDWMLAAVRLEADGDDEVLEN